MDILKTNGHPITVIAPEDKYTKKLTGQDGVHFIPLKKLDRDTTNIRANWQLYKEFKSIYNQVKPDLILHYTSKPIIFGGRAAHQLNIPSIAIITGLGYAFIRKGWLQWITRRLYKSAAKYHKTFVFENKDDLQLFEDHFIEKSQGMAIKGCGVDVDYFKSKKHIESEDVQFTFVGRLLKDKGIREFVEAAKLLKDKENIKFNIVGELDEENPSQISKSDLLQWINEDLISYFDFKDDIRPILEKASCVVLPSYREGMPRTILEAMSMAKPVIVSDVPGCRETVIDGVNGFICDVKSGPSLKNAMNKFLALDKNQQMEMGKKGRAMILDGFSSTQIAEKIFTIIQQNAIV